MAGTLSVRFLLDFSIRNSRRSPARLSPKHGGAARALQRMPPARQAFGTSAWESEQYVLFWMPTFRVSSLRVHFSGLHKIVVRPSPESTTEAQDMCDIFGAKKGDVVLTTSPFFMSIASVGFSRLSAIERGSNSLITRRRCLSLEPQIVPPRQGPLRSAALTCGGDPSQTATTTSTKGEMNHAKRRSTWQRQPRVREPNAPDDARSATGISPTPHPRVPPLTSRATGLRGRVQRPYPMPNCWRSSLACRAWRRPSAC